jgi:hypothetical protein
MMVQFASVPGVARMRTVLTVPVMFSYEWAGVRPRVQPQKVVFSAATPWTFRRAAKGSPRGFAEGRKCFSESTNFD